MMTYTDAQTGGSSRRTAHPDRPGGTTGITLIELLIVLAIIGILAAIAFPAYQNSVLKAHRATAKAELLGILDKQQNFHARNLTYTSTLTNLNYTTDPVITDDGRYSIAATTCTAPLSTVIANCVQLTATAQGAQIPDGGPLIINSAGGRTPANLW
jgi:type IV pilus assembly protein PilE